MRTSEVSVIRCALLQSLPPMSSRGPHAIPIASAGAKQSHAAIRSDVYRTVPCITHIDCVIIRGYFHHHDSGPQTSLAEIKGSLLRLQMEWARNDQLPSEVRRSFLPGELERKLSALPAGYERVLVSDDVLLIEAATGLIVDVLRDIHATFSPPAQTSAHRK